MLTMNFFTDLYNSEYFGVVLIGIIVVLVILFILVLIFGKRDEKKRKLEETQRLEQANINAMAEVNKEPSALEVPNNNVNESNNDLVNQTPVDTTPVINNQVDIPQVEIPTNVEPTVPMEPVSTNDYVNDNNLVQNINNNFNDLAVSINQELNDIDNLKEIKNNNINSNANQLPQMEVPSFDSVSQDFYQMPDVELNINPASVTETPNNNMKVPNVETTQNEPVQNYETPSYNMPSFEPVSESIPTYNEPVVEQPSYTYEAPTSSYSNTPYRPTTQFSSVNVAGKGQMAPTENPTVPLSSDVNSNMEVAVTQNEPVEEQKIVKTQPAGFEMPMLNPNLGTSDYANVVKPANAPKFAFEADESDSYHI